MSAESLHSLTFKKKSAIYSKRPPISSTHKYFNFAIVEFVERQNTILAKSTKQTIKKIEKDTDRNFFMNTDEAKAYGIIDTILVARKK